MSVRVIVEKILPRAKDAAEDMLARGVDMDVDMTNCRSSHVVMVVCRAFCKVKMNEVATFQVDGNCFYTGTMKIS